MCNCNEFEIWCEGTIQDIPFKTMEVIKTEPTGWTCLLQCPFCAQLWQVDKWDKYHHGIAIKFFGNKNTWETISDVEIRKEIIITNHNGISDRKCHWVDCKNNALGNIAFCVDHAYENGIRW